MLYNKADKNYQLISDSYILKEKRDYLFKFYLLSREWKKKAKKFLGLKKWRCEICGSRKKVWAFHTNKDNFHKETERDIAVLCRHCYEKSIELSFTNKGVKQENAILLYMSRQKNII